MDYSASTDSIDPGEGFEVKYIVNLALSACFAVSVCAGDVKVQLADLPTAVQAAVKEQTKTATLVGLSKETENGKTTWEAETTVNGKTRDVSFDKTGAIVAVEQEVDLNSIPAAAKAAIQRKVGKGTLKKVESVTEGKTVSYEATIVTNGKSAEVGVNADGTPHKED
jgi:uncharacterized membrane protein YkoI